MNGEFGRFACKKLQLHMKWHQYASRLHKEVNTNRTHTYVLPMIYVQKSNESCSTFGKPLDKHVCDCAQCTLYTKAHRTCGCEACKLLNMSNRRYCIHFSYTFTLAFKSSIWTLCTQLTGEFSTYILASA